MDTAIEGNPTRGETRHSSRHSSHRAALCASIEHCKSVLASRNLPAVLPGPFSRALCVSLKVLDHLRRCLDPQFADHGKLAAPEQPQSPPWLCHMPVVLATGTWLAGLVPLARLGARLWVFLVVPVFSPWLPQFGLWRLKLSAHHHPSQVPLPSSCPGISTTR
jgi:hypothetical protein